MNTFSLFLPTFIHLFTVLFLLGWIWTYARPSAALRTEGVGEQAKTAQCAVFVPRYPTKQGGMKRSKLRAHYDYATGEGNEKSHPRNQKRKQSIGLLFRFWNDVFRKRNVMRTSCVMTASPCDVRCGAWGRNTSHHFAPSAQNITVR